MIRLLLPFAIFLSAAASLAVELSVVRLGAPYVGQSLTPWSSAIASVLLGLTVGHVLGGAVAERAVRVSQLWGWLGSCWLAAGLFAFVVPAGVALMAPSFSGEGSHDAIAIAALAFPPSVAAGFIAPMAVRAASLMPSLQLPRMVATIYAASAAGSVIGTAFAGFLLFEAVGSVVLMRMVGTLWMFLGLIALSRFRWTLSRAGLLAGLIVAVAGTSAWLSGSGPCLREFRYTCIRILDQKLADGGLLRFLILDEGVHSASDRDNPGRMHLGYAALTDILARAAFRNATAPRALVIGGGGATLPRAWSSSVDVISVELDPVVASVAKTDMWAADVVTRIGDGRAVVRGLPPEDRFDVVLMDAYRTCSVPPHLVTREFDALVSARLQEQGVFLSNVIDRTENPLLALSIARTLSGVFPAVDIWASVVADGVTTNFVVAAWKDAASAYRPAEQSVVATTMEAGAAPRSQKIVWVRIDAAAARQRWPGVCAATLTDDWAPVERLLAGRPSCSDSPPHGTP